MTLSERIINGIVSLFFRLTCDVKINGIATLPATGPAILIVNHTSSLEGPLFYVGMRPRRTTAMAKKELWEKWFTRAAMKAWSAIPVDREDVDMKTLRSCFGVLDDGDFLCLAPEGTRGNDGALKRAMPGTVLFATRKSVPIYPMVIWGLRDWSANMKRLKRTEVHFRVGKPFVIEKVGDGKVTADDRRKIADEMMYYMADLLPPKFRGYYADESQRTTAFTRFL